MPKLEASCLNLFPCFYNCCRDQAPYIIDQKESIDSLREENESLKALKLDVDTKKESAQRDGMTPTNEVQNWLQRVEDEGNKVDKIIQKHDNFNAKHPCYRYCLCLFSYYWLGRKATKKIPIVTGLHNAGKSLDIAIQLPARLHNIVMEDPVGMESDFEKVWRALMDDNVGKIGLFGMGGVGKTTLLKRINNELSKMENNGFDVAIWVVASSKATDETVQQEILQKLQISSDKWGKRIEDNHLLLDRNLRGIKYVLMLDDVWDRLDFLHMGIPLPDNQNKCKIIFTTRSHDVCARLKADWTTEVNCLPPEKALTLFLKNVGEGALNSHLGIPRLAKMMADECKGLPLALITIGRAMACKKTPQEWEFALSQLKEYPSEFKDVGKYVLPILKFSYDNLDDSTLQKCFVYCSLFPEDYAIDCDKLVDLWMGEGYLDKHDVKKARNQGFSIIENLKNACLLESGISRPDNDLIWVTSENKIILWVKMHDVIRDMALSITSDCGKHNKKFITLEQVDLTRFQEDIHDLNENVEKVLLYANELNDANVYSTTNIAVDNSRNSTTCPQLSTLVVGFLLLNTNLNFRFFNFAPSLRVLDLSLRTSPNPISLEGISEFKNLEYLNLSAQRIESLPEECALLSKLRCLLMDDMWFVKEFPSKIIFSLTELLVFRMDSSAVYDENFMRGLDNLKKIQELSIYVVSIDVLKIFFKSKKLQECARFLTLGKIKYTNPWKLGFNKMKILESICIYSCNFQTIECNPTLVVFNYLHNVEIET